MITTPSDFIYQIATPRTYIKLWTKAQEHLQANLPKDTALHGVYSPEVCPGHEILFSNFFLNIFMRVSQKVIRQK